MIVNSPAGPLHLMADISEHQGAYPANSRALPDLAAYKAAGLDMVSIRIFSGWREDYACRRLLAQARALGLDAMWYGWIAPQNPVTSAMASLKRITGELVQLYGPPSLGYMHDVEDPEAPPITPSQYAAYIQQMCTVTDQLGPRSIYSSAWYWSNRLKGIKAFAGDPIIVASYPFQGEGGVPLIRHLGPDELEQYGTWAFQRGDRGQGSVPAEWAGQDWSGWQVSSLGRFPGFTGNVDVNLLRPRYVQKLRQKALPAPPIVITPTPVPDRPAPVVIEGEGPMPAEYRININDNLFLVGPGGVKPITPDELGIYADVPVLEQFSEDTSNRVLKALARGVWPWSQGELGQGPTDYEQIRKIVTQALGGIQLPAPAAPTAATIDQAAIDKVAKAVVDLFASRMAT